VLTLGLASLVVLGLLHFMAARQFSRAADNRAVFELVDERF
jgi:hypothetical protein